MMVAASLVQILLVMLAGVAGQADEPANVDRERLAKYEERMREPEIAVQGEASGGAGGQLAGGEAADELELPETMTVTLADLLHHVPDPLEARKEAEEELKQASKRVDSDRLESLLKYIGIIDRPKKLHLSLQGAIRRTMENSYAIRVQSYNPAIETTRVVEAEAAFDASFFANISNVKQDRPTGSPLVASVSEAFQGQTGIRKLLPSGMQVETSYVIRRSWSNLQYQTINPEWFDQFVVQFRQPLLRGFGSDVNRANIRIEQLTRRRATQEFRREVRDTVQATEEAYWRLVQARRNLVISAKLLASFEQIFRFLDERKDFDVYKIQLADVSARLESSKVDYAELVANVMIAEDQLAAAMNDPEVDLADDIEIIPTDIPLHEFRKVERLAEVQVALDNRSEIAEARLGVNIAKIQVGAAKNQALPQLDVSFSYAVDGLGGSADDSFDELTKHDYTEYTVGVEFELPVGNRARRAQLKRTELQHAQAIAGLKQVFEQVILDANIAVRKLHTSLYQIEPSLRSAAATEDQVASIIARAERKDYLTLNNELSTRQALAQTRSTLLSALVEYGLAIVDLERAKGTLLRYNGIDLVFDGADEDPKW